MRYLSDLIAVMYLGRIVEIGPTAELIADPRHPYTKVLFDSVPGNPGGGPSQARLLDGDPPDPHDPPRGCHFHPRCPIGPLALPERTICATEDPSVGAPQRARQAACHFVVRAEEPSGTLPSGR